MELDPIFRTFVVPFNNSYMLRFEIIGLESIAECEDVQEQVMSWVELSNGAQVH